MSIYEEVIEKIEILSTMARLLDHSPMITDLNEEYDMLWITSKCLTIIVTINKENLEMQITVTDNDKQGEIYKYFADKDFKEVMKALENLALLL